MKINNIATKRNNEKINNNNHEKTNKPKLFCSLFSNNEQNNRNKSNKNKKKQRKEKTRKLERYNEKF